MVDTQKTRIVPAAYPIGKWPHVSRARQPYAFEAITVVEEAPTADTLAGYQTTDQRFLLGPIHPHLFALQPGDAEGFIEFVEQLGLKEFLPWLADVGLGEADAWRPVIGSYEPMGLRVLQRQHLFAAWTDQTTIREYGAARKELRGLFEEMAQLGDALAAAEIVIALGEDRLLQIELRRDLTTEQIYERPRHIFSRAWFELLDGLLQQAKVPRICAYCHHPFVPTRSDQRHCPGTLCQARNSDRKRRQDPWRKEYDKMRQRRNRDAITSEEFDRWITNNPRPKEAAKKEE